jgi:glycosyltransferase involved in cell wall biosynthesis
MNNNTKKVIIFTLPDFRGGGAERVFLNLINNIDRDFFDIHVVVGKFKGEYCTNLKKDISIHELSCVGSIACIPRMLRVVQNIKPDIVISTLGFVVTVSIISHALPKRIKIISRFGNTISSFLQDIKKISQLKYYLQYMLNRLVIHSSDVVIVQSDHMLRDLVQVFSLKNRSARKIIKINNPVDCKGLNLASQLEKVPLSIKSFVESSFVFVSVGRLESQKNYEDLLKSFKIVHNSCPKSKLLILGEGSCRNDLNKLISNLSIGTFVLMPGFIANTEAAVHISDFFVSSSLYEGMSNAILESLALGIPVIATDCPSGIREVVHDGDSGFLVSIQGDVVKNLAEKMLFVYNNKSCLNTSNIKKIVQENFDIHHVVGKYESVFQD